MPFSSGSSNNKNSKSDSDYGSIPKLVEHLTSTAGSEDDDDDDDDDKEHDSIHKYKQQQAGNTHSMIHTIRSTVRSIMIFGGENASLRQLQGQASISSTVFNIAKNLVGSGCLSLPGGIALYANDPWAALSACVLMCVVGSVFAYFCILQGRICRTTHSFSYGESWEAAVGERGALAVSLVIATYPALGCLGCSIILCETFASLSETVGLNLGRNTCLLLITTLALLPLCLLKNLAVLAPFSFIGVAVTVLAAAAMVLRYADGSYLPSGQFYDDIDSSLQPAFGHRQALFSLHVLPFICMIFAAYVMHYNSPRFYVELKEVTVPRYTKAVSGAFGLSTAIYLVMATAGFLTFGGNCDSFILNNYSPHDPAAAGGRLAIAISVLLNFPVSFIGFRDAVLDVFKIPIELQTSRNVDVLTVILLTIITVVAASVSDLGMVNALAGGLFGILIVFVFPTVMFRAVEKNTLMTAQSPDVGLATGLMVVGVAVGVIGTFVSIFMQS